MYIKKYIRQNIYNPLVNVTAKVFLHLKWLNKFVLVRVDGGICSQMHFYMVGKEIEKHGFLVKYDLSWFRESGMDMNGVHVRNFDLIKAFPSLPFKEANKLECILYQTFAKPHNYMISEPYEWVNSVPPVYLNSYYRSPQGMYESIHELFKIDTSVLDERNFTMFNEIVAKTNSVAVHVRRGDLAVFNEAYGEPVSTSYFQKSMSYIESYIGCPGYYYFFSDDPDWVKLKLVPDLCLNNNFQVIDFNGSDKGYMDLFLISACRNQITSKGSLGKFGGFLCIWPNNKIVIYDDKYQRGEWENQTDKMVFVK